MSNLKEQLQLIANGQRNNEIRLDGFKGYLIKEMREAAFKGKNKIEISSFSLWYNDDFNDLDLIDSACKWLKTEGIKAFIKYKDKNVVIDDKETKLKKGSLCVSWECS